MSSHFQILKSKSPRRPRQRKPNPRFLLFGGTGSGKTRTIAELLRRGEKVMMLHCGLGPPGVKTIREYLTVKHDAMSADEIIRNQFRQVRITNIETLSDLALRGIGWIEASLKDEPKFFKSLDTLVIEEFNGAQGLYERYIVPMEDGFPRQTMTRVADESKGSDGSYGHYANIKMATEYLVSTILELPLKHIWTTHESQKLKALRDSGDIGPLIQTRAVVGLVGAFPFSIRVRREQPMFDSGGYEYFYSFKDGPFTKAQLESCPDEMKADPEKLWNLIYGPA